MSRFEAMRGRRHDERGVVIPTRLAALGVSALALGALVLVATGLPKANPVEQEKAAPAKAVQTTASPTASATPTLVKPKPKPKPKVVRKDVYVEVFNNSGVSGLARTTATKAQSAGWNVIGQDNWYGTIASSTVYFPPRLEAAAKLLAKDMNINRVKPAIAPMGMDRLTLILTSDYSR